MPKQAPLVSIITLNYNQTCTTCAFLESTRQLAYVNYEILVCDMASDADPSAIEENNYPNTKLLRCHQNLGFAGGNNWGIRQAKGDFIFIVNNDTEVPPDLIHLLLEPFDRDPTVGACSPKIKYFYDRDIIQYAGFMPINPFTGRTSTIGETERDRGQYGAPGYTSAAHGCAMMIKKAVLDQVGMFPESFFLYYEEWDLSARMTRAGYTLWYAADAVIYHKESVSVGKENPEKVYYLTRNRILYMRRNTSSVQFFIFCLFFAFVSVPKAVLVNLIKGRFSHLNFFFKGVMWNMFHSSHSAT